ncbi:hypothetical protein ACP70R_021196 [Stipagrostis hirtigluma subsp. patula]
MLSLPAPSPYAAVVDRRRSTMSWRNSYLDMVLIPLALLFPAAYHLWLWRAVRRRPLRTTLGINAATRRLWVLDMMKMQDEPRKPLLVVQPLRNVIMGSTVVATTSIILCTGVAAVLSTTYAGKKPIDDAVLGARGEVAVLLKYGAVLVVFVLVFFCQTLSTYSLNQACFLVNTLPAPSSTLRLRLPVTVDYVVGAVERGFLLNFAGNRLFYAGVPLLLWIFGPILSCICSLAMTWVLYKMDIVACNDDNGNRNGDADKKEKMDFVGSDDEIMQV